jgi:hypothetical protein
MSEYAEFAFSARSIAEQMQVSHRVAVADEVSIGDFN